MSAPLSASACPRLPRGGRLRQDRVRGVPVLLGPEVALILDPVGEAVIAEVDGARSIAAISACLASRYGAPEAEVTGDVSECLGDLALRRLVDLA